MRIKNLMAASTLALVGLGAASAQAVDFTDASTVSASVTVPGYEDIEVVFAQGTVEDGDELWRYCRSFIAETGLEDHPGFTVETCLRTVGMIEGWDQPEQFDHIAVGQKIWLPTIEDNDSSQFVALVADGHFAEVFGSDANPDLIREALGVTVTTEDMQALSEAVNEHLETLAGRVNALDDAVVDIDGRVDEQSGRIDNVSADLEQAINDFETQLANVQDSQVTEESVSNLIDSALADLQDGQLTAEEIDAHVENYIAENDFESDVDLPAMEEELRGLLDNRLSELQEDLADKADQETVDGLSDGLTDLENRFADGNGTLPVVSTPWGEVPVFTALWAAIIAAAVIGVVAVFLALIFNRRRKQDVRSVETTANEAKNTAEAAQSTAGGMESRINTAEGRANAAHTLAAASKQESRVAINLGLPDDWELFGSLPNQEQLAKLGDGESVALQFRHETKGERSAIFTMSKGSIKGPDGNMVDGLLVEGIIGLQKPIAVNGNNMIGKVRNGIKSNKFVGVDKEGRTNGPTSMTA